MEDDVLTRNSSDELALRVTQSSGDTGTNKEDVYTRDSQGRLAVRTVGDSGGGDSLPDQTGNAGKFLMTDGTTASWGLALANKATYVSTFFVSSGTQGMTTTWSVVLGYNAYCNANGVVSIGFNSSVGGVGGVAVGRNARAGTDSVAIGQHAQANAQNAIQLGGVFGHHENPDANTFKVSNANGNFEMMDENGNVPLERLTYVTDQIGDISTALTAILGE